MHFRLSSPEKPLSRLQNEYDTMLKAGFTCSIARLINDRRYPLQQYCKPFTPHPATKEIVQAAKAFCEGYGIWLDNAQHYITCQLYLYPDASTERILFMTWNNAIDYYLNDTMGRDLFKRLSIDQQQAAAAMITRMASLDVNLLLPPDSLPIEQANITMLRKIRDTSPADWFSEFLNMYNYHLEVTHRNCNSAALGYVPTVSEYVDMRYHTSGMPHIALLLQYAGNNFLDWNWLEDVELAVTIKRLHYLVALFGCLSNDLFSFEKEVIDNSADANLLAAIALNEPAYSLPEVIFYAGIMVRDVLTEYFDLLGLTGKQIAALSMAYPEKALQLSSYMGSIEKAVQASWMWQAYTQRYKREHSIWEETTKVVQQVAKAG